MKLNKQNRFIMLSMLCLLSLSTMAQIAKPTSVPQTSTTPSPKPTVYSIIEQVRKKYAPDKRVAFFQAELDSNRIVGKTNLPAAKKDLLNRLKSNGYALLDAVKLLPDNDLLENRNCGIANISVLNLRSQPKESAELASQALLGTPLKVLDRERNWYMIQTPDNYIGWADGSTFARITQYQFDRYQANKFLMFAKPYGFSYTKADENSQTISDLTWGNVLAVKDTLQDFYEVIYPDGRNAFILKKKPLGIKNGNSRLRLPNKIWSMRLSECKAYPTYGAELRGKGLIVAVLLVWFINQTESYYLVMLRNKFGRVKKCLLIAFKWVIYYFLAKKLHLKKQSVSCT